MNRTDAFRRGIAAVLIASMVALAVAPASAGQQEGTGQPAVVSPSETVEVQTGGTGEAPPSLAEDALLSQGSGTGEAPPSLAPGDVLFGQSGGSGQSPPSVAAVRLDHFGGTNAALAPA